VLCIWFYIDIITCWSWTVMAYIFLASCKIFESLIIYSGNGDSVCAVNNMLSLSIIQFCSNCDRENSRGETLVDLYFSKLVFIWHLHIFVSIDRRVESWLLSNQDWCALAQYVVKKTLFVASCIRYFNDWLPSEENFVAALSLVLIIDVPTTCSCGQFEQ